MKMLILPEIEPLIKNVCWSVIKDCNFINDIIHNRWHHWKTIVVFTWVWGNWKNTLIKFLQKLDRWTIYISTNKKISYLQSNTHYIKVIWWNKVISIEDWKLYNSIINKFIEWIK